MLNLLITKKLTIKEFRKLKDNIDVNEDFLTVFFRVEKRRPDMEKEILKEMTEKIATFACSDNDNAQFIIDYLEDQYSLDRFHKQCLRKIKKKGDNLSNRTKMVINCYAI
jgi:hypothetical protein